MITKQIPITISIILVHFAKLTELVNLLITTPKANKYTTFKIAKNSEIIKL